MARIAERIELLRHPTEMTGEELRAALPDTDAVIMRSLIIAEVQRIRGGADQEPRTLRNLWYWMVKPALSRMGLLDKTTRGGNPIDWPGKLSDYTAELVRDDLTSYEELRIIDGSRARRPAAAVSHTVAAVQVVGAHYPWLIIHSEKDTMWGTLETLARLYGVTALSSKGQPSFACTANVVDAIRKSKAYNYNAHPVVLLSFTDYDPHGYSIAESQFAQLQEIAGDFCDVYQTRLGLFPEQLTPEQRQRNAYKPKRKGLAKWYRQHGGVDGQPLGLELDALSLSRVRRMFAEGIEAEIDIRYRQADLSLALVELLAWEVLQVELELDRKLEEMKQAVKSDDVWRQVMDAELPEDLFRQAADAGWDSIDPTTTKVNGHPLFDCTDRLKTVMRKALL